MPASINHARQACLCVLHCTLAGKTRNSCLAVRDGNSCHAVTRREIQSISSIYQNCALLPSPPLCIYNSNHRHGRDDGLQSQEQLSGLGTLIKRTSVGVCTNAASRIQNAWPDSGAHSGRLVQPRKLKDGAPGSLCHRPDSGSPREGPNDGVPGQPLCGAEGCKAL